MSCGTTGNRTRNCATAPCRPAPLLAALAACAVAVLPVAASAASCGNGPQGFNAWIAAYKGRAKAAGISEKAINAGLAGVSYDAGVVRLDRNQKSFKLSFEQFYKRRVSSSLIARGKQRMATHKGLLDRIQKQYGVPPAVIVSIWGLETNYGADGHGGKSIVRSIATLAYDCRRSAFFENELTNALRIIDRGDMTPSQLVGGWAGEIGPMQFLPSSYIKHAVDFDGDGRRNLKSSVPDMLASTAKFLKAHGWQAGQPWGPGTHNFNVIKGWNRAEVYQRTIAVMSTKLAGG